MIVLSSLSRNHCKFYNLHDVDHWSFKLLEDDKTINLFIYVVLFSVAVQKTYSNPWFEKIEDKFRGRELTTNARLVTCVVERTGTNL